MSKYNPLLIILLIILPSCFGRHPTVTTEMEGKPLPSFNMLLTDSITKINTDNIVSGRPFVLFYFSPYCPYCKAQTETLIKNMQSMQDLRFYFLSNFPLPTIKQYSEKYELNKFKNIIIGQDYESYFSNIYKVPGVPYIAIYGENKLLKQSVLGNVGANLIMEIAER